jgi:hypothetical protein
LKGAPLSCEWKRHPYSAHGQNSNGPSTMPMFGATGL